MPLGEEKERQEKKNLCDLFKVTQLINGRGGI